MKKAELETIEKNYYYDNIPGSNESANNFMIKKTIPLITVVVEKTTDQEYLKRVQNSLLNQTFPHWELIIISNNKSELKVSADSRISLITIKKDSNYLDILKKRKYIIFLKTELLVPTFLETCYWTLETNPEYSLVYSDRVFFNEKKLIRKILNERMNNEKDQVFYGMLFRSEALFNLKISNEDNKNSIMEKILLTNKAIKIPSLGIWSGDKYLIKDDPEKEFLIYSSGEKNYPHSSYNWGILPDNYKQIVDDNILEIKYPITKKEKVKLLFIVPWLIVGGADKFNIDLLEGLNYEEYEVYIITTEPSYNIWENKFINNVTQVFHLPQFIDRENWHVFIDYAINKFNINIVLISNSRYGYSIIPFLKEKNPNIPIIDYIHSEEWHNRGGGYSRDTSNFDTLIDKTYYCTNKSKNILVNHFGRKESDTKTVYIGVDEKRFDPSLYTNLAKAKLKEKFGIDKDKKIVTFVGRVVDVKRPFLLAEIVKKTVSENDSIQFLIVGDGPLLESLKEELKEQADNITLPGLQDKMEDIYAISDITINCSIQEGLPLTTYESLAMDVPCVVSDVGGQKELVVEETGFVLPVYQTENQMYDYDYSEKEINQYVDAINYILNNQDKYQIKCRQRVISQFTTSAMQEIMRKELFTISKTPSQEKISNAKVLSKNQGVIKELITQALVAYNDGYKSQIDLLKLEEEEKTNIISRIFSRNRLKKIIILFSLIVMYVYVMKVINVDNFIILINVAFAVALLLMRIIFRIIRNRRNNN